MELRTRNTTIFGKSRDLELVRDENPRVRPNSSKSSPDTFYISMVFRRSSSCLYLLSAGGYCSSGFLPKPRLLPPSALMLWSPPSLLSSRLMGCCDTVAEPTVILVLHFTFANVAVSKSLHRIFFYTMKERVKRTEKTFFEISEYGG